MNDLGPPDKKNWKKRQVEDPETSGRSKKYVRIFYRRDILMTNNRTRISFLLNKQNGKERQVEDPEISGVMVDRY